MVYDKNVEVARHEQLIAKGACRLELDHYLETLIRKPGAFPGATAVCADLIYKIEVLKEEGEADARPLVPGRRARPAARRSRRGAPDAQHREHHPGRRGEAGTDRPHPQDTAQAAGPARPG